MRSVFFFSCYLVDIFETLALMSVRFKNSFLIFVRFLTYLRNDEDLCRLIWKPCEQLLCCS